MIRWKFTFRYYRDRSIFIVKLIEFESKSNYKIYVDPSPIPRMYHKSDTWLWMKTFEVSLTVIKK